MSMEKSEKRQQTTRKKKEEKHFKQLSDFSLWLQKIKNTFVFFFFKYFYAISTFSVKHQNVFLLGEVQSRAGKKNDISGKSNDERERKEKKNVKGRWFRWIFLQAWENFSTFVTLHNNRK